CREHQEQRNRPETEGIRRGHAEEHSRQQASSGQCEGNAYRDSSQDRAKTLNEGQTHHLTRRCSKRHADSDLPPSLTHREGHETREPNRSKQERDRGKRCKEI